MAVCVRMLSMDTDVTVLLDGQGHIVKLVSRYYMRGYLWIYYSEQIDTQHIIYFHLLDINECASNPCKNGLCQDDVNRYRCDCTAGWTGTHCETSE